MGVYKEQMHELESLASHMNPVFNDACDIGTPDTPSVRTLIQQLLGINGQEYPLGALPDIKTSALKGLANEEYGRRATGRIYWERETYTQWTIDWIRLSPQMQRHPSLMPAFKGCKGYYTFSFKTVSR